VRGVIDSTDGRLSANVFYVADERTVGRCRLTVSEPVLKAPLVSALESTIR